MLILKFSIGLFFITNYVIGQKSRTDLTLLTKRVDDGVTVMCVSDKTSVLVIESNKNGEEFDLISSDDEYLNAFLVFDMSNNFELKMISKDQEGNYTIGYTRRKNNRYLYVQNCVNNNCYFDENIMVDEYIVDNKLNIIIAPKEQKLYIRKVNGERIKNLSVIIKNISIKTDSKKEIYLRKSNYAYHRIDKTREVIRLNEFKDWSGDKLCLSFILSMCEKCNITLIFTNADGFHKEFSYNETRSYHNNYIVLEPYSKKIFVSAVAYNTDEKYGYWTIDLHYCNTNEYNVLSYNTKNNYNFACMDLITGERVEEAKVSSNYDVCDKRKYFGTNCNISCKEVTKTEFCDQYQICWDGNKCTCAAGYRGDDCRRECSDGYYGYNCNKECSKNCKSKPCEKKSGRCIGGCTDGYQPPFCNDFVYPRLLKTLRVVETGIDFIQLRIDNIEHEGVKTPKFFKIQYKTVSKSDWSLGSFYYPLQLDQMVTIRGLKKSTDYQIRAVLFVQDDKNFNENVQHITVRTKCKDADKLSYETTSTSIKIIYPIENDEVCYYTDYRLYVDSIERNFDLKGMSYKDDLKPFTKYQILLCKDSCLIKDTIRTDEDAPSKVRNLTISANTYSMKLNWEKPLEINGVLRDYVINYKLIKHRGCRIQQIETYTYERNTNDVPFYLDNLVPYAEYEIIIYARNSKNGVQEIMRGYTLPTVTVDMDEIISKNVVNTIAGPDYITIDWVPIECKKRKGPLQYNFAAICDSTSPQKWCNDTKFIRTNAYDETTRITNLVPYTDYKLYISATRNNSLTETRWMGNIKTKSDVPPLIYQMDVFTKDETYLVLRWLPPYPPHGRIERYRIRLNTGGDVIIQQNEIKHCELWSEYICHNLTGLAGNSAFWIEIYAKNYDTKEYVMSSNDNVGLSARTKQEAPLKPENLKHTWLNNSLILKWEHPRKENGPIKKFLILLKIHSTKLLAKVASKTYEEYYEITRPQKEYTYKVKSKFLLSTLYNITVCGVNEHYGENSTDYLEALKLEPPKFLSERFTYTVESKNLLRIDLPEINLLTITDETYIFIIVNRLKELDGTEATNDYANFCDNIRKKNLEVYHNRNNWVAIEEQLDTSVKTLVLGTGIVVRSELLSSQSLLNRKLNLEEKSYGINVILITKYNSDLICTVYDLPTYVPGKMNSVYFFLLLLIVPIIAVVVYLVYKKKISDAREKNTDNPSQELNVLRTTDNDTEHENRNVTENSILLHPEKKSDTPETPRVKQKILVLPELENSVAKPIVRVKPSIPEKPKKLAVPEKSGESKKPNLPEKINKSTGKLYHSKLISINELKEYFRNAIENEELKEQHKLFPRGQTKPWDYGIKTENKFKNRYINLAAYDHNRVVLERINGDSYSDYINASYINGYKQMKAYIATQGPRLTTINDFWRMIWQENVHNIVMLANLIEGGKKKCERYWPELEETKQYGKIKVTYLKNDIYADFEYRTFQIQYEFSNRTVEQYHFTSWPDHGVPVYPQSLIPFLKKTVNISYKNGPIVVHCSAGIGRTGTIILTDICLRMAIVEEKIDVLRYFQELREQRINMVDNVDQYTLVYTLLMEYLLAPETSLSCINFKQTLERIKADGTIGRHFNYLKQTLWQDGNYSRRENYNNENDSKNRNENIIPKGERIHITFDGETNSNYINAVPVDGFRLKNHFIATQTPMPNTIQDFWAMIKEQNVTVIVALNDIPITDNTCCQYYPSIQEELATSRGLKIAHVKTEMFQYYDIIYLEIKYKNIQEETNQIQLIQVKGWNYNKKTPNKSEMLFTLFEDLEILSRAKHPICITCYDGATACGLFIALSFLIEKIKLEQQVDVCLAVRIIRRNRLEFIRDEKQFKYLYDAADEFLDKFEDYWNFR